MNARLAYRLVGEQVSASSAGGKGAALDRLVALSAPVPTSGVVSTEAYRVFAAQPQIADFLDALISSPVPAPAEHERARARVDELFLSGPLSPAIAEAVDELVNDVASGERVAVRSSATAEDLGAASFAGQYESYLNVEPGNVHDAVRRVWASLWYPSPRSYRFFRGITEHDLAMAVVVMRMLDPAIAGVLFTQDPGGRPGAVRLEVVQGLGEQLVSGTVTPDAHVVLREEMIAAFSAIAAPLGMLASEAVRLEAAFGAAQDIEFAVQDDQLFLVQARPITTQQGDTAATDDGFDFSCGIDTTYTTAGVTEMLPGVLPPLVWGVNSWLVENGFRTLFDTLGGGAEVLSDGHALIGRFGGRAALNLDAMRGAAASIPGGSPEELEQQYFGPVARSDEDNRRTDEALTKAGSGGARQGLRVLQSRRRAAAESELAIQTVTRIVEYEPDLAQLNDVDLFAYWNRLLHVSQRVAAAEIVVAAMASASYRSLEVFLGRYLKSDEASAAAQDLTATDAAQRRARVALAVESVVARLAADGGLADAADQDWDTTRRHLESSEVGKGIVQDLLAAWQRAGSTGVFAGPTWEEVPQLAWLVVYQELVEPSQPIDPTQRAHRQTELERRLTHSPKWRAARLATMQILDVRRRFLHRQAGEAAEFLARREFTKSAYLQLGGVVRRCHQEFGRRLVDRKRLEDADEIAYMSIDEISGLGDQQGPTLYQLSRRRRIGAEESQAPALPLVWTGLPPEVSSAEVTGERFEGWSASPGRFEGTARVVRTPQSAELHRGDVLVAETTDASWAPLFMAAGAIVVEQGGPLSHAAIVARELGLPAVVNVPGIIARLDREGGAVPVIVDGSAGVVTIQAAPGDDPHGAPTGVPANVPYAPARVPDPRWDDTSPPVGVFVAGLMGASALMSAIVGLTESISSTQGRERLRRRAAPVASATANGVVAGFETAASSPIGLRRRTDYTIVAVLAVIVGASIGARSIDLYAASTLGVLGFASSLTGALTLCVVGVVAGFSAVVWPNVPSIVRRLAPGYPPPARSMWSTVSRPARVAIAIMASLVVVGAVAVVGAPSWVSKVDERIYSDWLDARSDVDRWGPDWFVRFGQPIPVVMIAVVVFLITFLRSRTVALAYPLAVTAGGAILYSLNWTVHRLRPPLSVHAGEYNSYPGGHSIQLALVLLALPLVVWVLTANRFVRVIGTIVPFSVWFVAEADTIRTGGHWPIDQVAGMLIATCLLIVVYSVGLDATRTKAARDNPPTPARAGRQPGRID